MATSESDERLAAVAQEWYSAKESLNAVKIERDQVLIDLGIVDYLEHSPKLAADDDRWQAVRHANFVHRLARERIRGAKDPMNWQGGWLPELPLTNVDRVAVFLADRLHNASHLLQSTGEQVANKLEFLRNTIENTENALIKLGLHGWQSNVERDTILTARNRLTELLEWTKRAGEPPKSELPPQSSADSGQQNGQQENNSPLKLPKNHKVYDLIRALNDPQNDGASIKELALEIAEQDEKKAKSIRSQVQPKRYGNLITNPARTEKK